MKYGSLKGETQKVLNIPALNKGIDLLNAPENIEKGGLTKGVNVWFEGGRLKTRPGITANADNIIQSQVEECEGERRFEFTDTLFFHDGEFKRIVTERFYCDISGYVVCVYLLSANGSITDIGYIYLGRLNDDVFYTPRTINFYVGKPQNGGGIFALVSLMNEVDKKSREYRIFEITSDLDDWVMVSGYYIPTVYINGRGNAYEFASEAVNAAEVDKPKELEALNMLDGSFYSYYTSDGYSYSFRLPFTNIAERTITCRIYQTPDSYTEWKIDGDKTKASATFFDIKVYANINRDKGLIYFTTESGNYPVPAMDLYSENNIRFLASVDIPKGMQEVVSTTCTATIGSRILLSGGATNNKLFCTKYENPLYFPRNTDVAVGFSDSKVISLVKSGDKIIALKPSGVYSISLKKGKNINDTALLPDNDNIFYEKDTFDIKCIENDVGCSNKNAVACVMDNVFWQGTDRHFYSLTQSGKRIRLTNKSAPYLDELSNLELKAGAVIPLGEYYMLSFAEKAIIIKYNIASLEEEGAYIWTFPEGYSIVGGKALDGKCCLVLENTEENTFFTAVLKENEDTLISNDLAVTHPIKSRIITPRYSMGGLRDKVKIKSVYLQLHAKGKVEIRLKAGNRLFADYIIDRAEFNRYCDNLVKLIPELHGAEWLEVSVKSDKELALGEIEAHYTKLLK